MLSPGRLLHLVFADANDTYYCNEILALDFHQYLWLKLHEQGFSCVYFLTRQEDAAVPEILTYGDDLAKPFRIKSGIFGGKKNAKKALCEWITNRLCENGKELSAIVCTMEDFCALFSEPDSKDFLQGLSNSKKRCGSIILTSSPEAEESKPLLLQSMAFEYLGEPGIIGVRKAGPCDMYGFIKDSMGEGMVYLNTFTKERLHCLIARLLLEDQKRSENCHLQRHMEDYLLQWMNNHDFRNAEQQRGSRFPSPYVSHLELHNRLNDPAMWSTLSERAERIAQSGGIRAYADLLGCSCVGGPPDKSGVRRKAEAYAGQCLRLSLNGSYDVNDRYYQKTLNMLAEVKRLVCTPKNLPENLEITKAIDEIRNTMQSDLVGNRDVGTAYRCVQALVFCLRMVNVEAGSQEEEKAVKVIQLQKDRIHISRAYHSITQKIQYIKNIYENESGFSSLDREKQVYEEALENCDEAMVLLESNNAQPETELIDRMIRRTDDIIKELQHEKPVLKGNHPDPQSAYIPELDPEDRFF